MRRKNLLCIFKLYMCFNFLCLISCKYNSEDLNFHEIKPPDKDAKVSMNLADVPNGQTVYIYAPTDLSYAINATSGSIAKQEFYLNNKLVGSEKAVLHIKPSDLAGGTSDILKVKVELSSGTGSLAEVLGQEKSAFEFTYPIKYINPQVNLNINQRINSSKKLEIYWTKPAIEGAEIESYEIYNFSNLDQILINRISDPDKNSFVDDDYSYGAKTYKIITKYKGNKVPPKEDYYSVKYKVFTSDYFKMKTLKNLNLNIQWTHPDGIANKYIFVWKGNRQSISLGKNNAEVYRPSFPFQEEQYYELYILPEQANDWDYAKYPKIINYFKEQKYDDEIDYAHMIMTEGDIKNNLILSMRGIKNGFGLRSYGINDLVMKSRNDDHIQYPFYINSFQIAPTTGKVAVHIRSDIYENKPKIEVYTDYTLSKKLGTYETDDFPVYFLTDDDKILIRNNNQSYRFRIYDVNSGKLLSEKTENGQQFRPSISPNGKYIVSAVGAATGWYKLYKYENNEYTLLTEKTESRIVNAFYFHPTIQNQVIIQSIDNYFSICELPTLKVIKKVPGEFLSYDSFNGNILFKDEYFSSNSLVNVLDNTYSNILFSMTTGNYFQPYQARLLNNNIILYNNYVNIVQ